MSEREPKISRRIFLSVSGCALAAACLPRVLVGSAQSDLLNQTASDSQKRLSPPVSAGSDLPSQEVGDIRPQDIGTAKEEEVIEGIKVIDNIGIDIQGEKVDVIVDTSLVKASILAKAGAMINSKYLPDLEKALDRLVISFGARPYHEVVDTVLSEMLKQDLDGGFRLSPIRRMLPNLNLWGNTPAPYGAFFSGVPMVYLNLSAILQSNLEFKDVWDHETAHLVYSFDPCKKEGVWEGTTEKTLIQLMLAVSSTISIGLAECDRLAKQDGIGLREYIRTRKENFTKLMSTGFMLMMFGSSPLARSIHYYLSDDDEILAREAEGMFSTPQAVFDKMVRIVPHGFINPKWPQASANRQSKL